MKIEIQTVKFDLRGIDFNKKTINDIIYPKKEYTEISDECLNIQILDEKEFEEKKYAEVSTNLNLEYFE